MKRMAGYTASVIPNRNRPLETSMSEQSSEHPNRPRSATTAAVLEGGCGLFLQTFGVGHIFQGRVGLGLTLMVIYWIVQLLNIALIFVGVGLITFPLTLLASLMISPTIVANSAARA